MTVAENVAFKQMFTETIGKKSRRVVCFTKSSVNSIISYPQRFQEECKRVAIARTVNKPKYLL
jgi:hypothetical protein